MEDMAGLNVYRGKQVLVTGHTGFKGAWLCIWLKHLGAKVVGVSLEDSDNGYVYKKTGLGTALAADLRADINDYDKLKSIFDSYSPEVVFHLAAQPLVRLSYDIPVETLSTNILGTAHVMECIRNTPSVRTAIMITTDKCYKNKERPEPYSEDDELGGYDPYSASKACAEIVIGSYRNSFLQHSGKLVASVRAGNVLGGGDFAKDRLVPDCIRSLMENKEIEIRSPESTRPWQFILDLLHGYLLLGSRLIKGERGFAEAWNFGPEESSVLTVREVVDAVIKNWGSGKVVYAENSGEKKHEAKLLHLSIDKAKSRLGWKPRFGFDDTIKHTVDWYRQSPGKGPGDLMDLCIRQIDDFMGFD